MAPNVTRRLEPTPGRRDWYRAPLSGLAICAALVQLAGCVPLPPDPFRVPAEQLTERIQTIALAPPLVPETLGDREAFRELVEPEIRRRIAEAGLNFVASDIFAELWRRAAADLGPLYDEKTGEADPERWETARSLIYRDLAAEHGVDAVLYVFVERWLIQLPASRITMHGDRKVPLYATQGRVDNAMLAGGSRLVVSAYDMEVRPLFTERAGIETLETYAHQRHAYRPREQRMQDPGTVTAALEVALTPFIVGLTTPYSPPVTLPKTTRPNIRGRSQD